ERSHRPRLLRRPRHQRLHRLAGRGDRSGGRGRGRRRRPGRGGHGGDPPARAGLRCGRVRRRRRQGRVRVRVLHARAAGERPVPGPLPAGVGAVAPGDRQAPRPGRAPVRRHHRRARLHGQGQRPGPVRGRHRQPGSRAPGDRARPRLRLDPREGHRLRGGEGAADQPEQEVALLHRPERVGPRRGDRLPGGHLERSGRGRLRLHRRPDGAPRRRRGDRHLPGRRARRDRRPAGVGAPGHPAAEHPGGRPGGRPARHGRGPAGGHQEPRGLRGAGRHRADHGAHGAGERDGRARAGPVQARGRPALGRARVRRAVVLPAEAGARHLHRRGAGGGVGGDPDDAARRPGDGDRAAQRHEPLRLQPRHLRRGRQLRPVAGPRLHRALRDVEQAGRPPRRPVHGTSRRDAGL
ncbi:MAG: Argininosuccinate synthase, partial [uncultured Friedmanniella sp.]